MGIRRLLSFVSLVLVLALALAVGGASARPDAVTLQPTSGPATGGTLVTFAGGDFSNVVSVYFGSAEATIASRAPNPLEVTAPPGTGTVDVTLRRLEDDGKTITTSGVGTFSYVPVVTSLTPDKGTVSGDTQVTIAGAGFTAATAVQFGDDAATDFTVDSDTRITATSPPGGGIQDVTVTAPTGTSAVSGDTKFMRRLAVTGASPGPGESQFTLEGIGFAVATAIHVGDSYAGFASLSDTEIVVAAPPPRSGGVVVVDTPYGSTQPVTYTGDTGGSATGIASTTSGASPGGAGGSGSSDTHGTPPGSVGVGTSSAGAGTAATAATALGPARVRRHAGGPLVTARLRVRRPGRLTVQVRDRHGRPRRISVGRHAPARSIRIPVERPGIVTIRIRVRDTSRPADLRRLTVAATGAGAGSRLSIPIRH